MKTTLENSYCRPQNEAEWLAVAKQCKKFERKCHQKDATTFYCIDGGGRVADYIPFERTEIPVQHFIDLVEDKICAWRLIEDGFINKVWDFYDLVIWKSESKWCISVINGEVPLNGELLNIANHTELLTLIRFLK